MDPTTSRILSIACALAFSACGNSGAPPPIQTDAAPPDAASDATTDAIVGDGAAPLVDGGPAPTPITVAVEPCPLRTWCWEGLNLARGASLRGASGSAAYGVFAVGTGGAALRDDGSGWKWLPTGASETLNAVWTGTTIAAAVGNGGRVAHFSGGRWTLLNSTVSANLNAVWGSDDNTIFAAGAGGTVLRFDGRGWAALPKPTGHDFHAIWGSSRNRIFFGGDNGRVVRLDGDGWTTLNTGTSANIRALWGLADDDIYALAWDGDTRDRILHFDGTTWSSVYSEAVQPQTRNTELWGVSSDAIFVAKNGLTSFTPPVRRDQALLRRFDGNEMRALAVSGQAIGALWGEATDELFVVGAGGLITQYNGATLDRLGGYADDLADIWGTSPEDVRIIGTSSADWRLWQRSGSNWVERDMGQIGIAQAARGFRPQALWGSGGNDITAVASPGITSVEPNLETILEFDGAGWRDVSLEHASGSYALRDLWGVSADERFAVGSVTTAAGSLVARVLRRETTGVWAPMNLTGNFTLNALWGTGSSNIFAAGSHGTVIHFNGERWSSPINTSSNATLRGVWSIRDTVFAVGSGGTILRRHSGRWSRMDSPTTRQLNGVWGTNESNVYAVGTNGVILHFDGGRWEPQDSGTAVTLNTIWGPRASAVFVVGEDGAILQLRR